LGSAIAIAGAATAVIPGIDGFSECVVVFISLRFRTFSADRPSAQFSEVRDCRWSDSGCLGFPEIADRIIPSSFSTSTSALRSLGL
jgi:hypothetical protein